MTTFPTKFYRIVIGNTTRWYYAEGKKYYNRGDVDKDVAILIASGDPAEVVEFEEGPDVVPKA